ncbi:Fanconi anemia group A protein homolog [Saccostrea echinata]|uniref:Fanconi anemia group A protein homolog n=1 Tax=Saccostrea echinata TaxID=191078 RepID=UPI002A82CAE4|nr:Fanconi anemia group A protein homolog [Saccostrea echinata]
MSDSHLIQEVLGSYTEQNTEVLSQRSREELKNAVLQLVTYHYNNTAAVTEVADLLSSSELNVKGVLESCVSPKSQSEANALSTLETCVNTILSLVKKQRNSSHNEEIKGKLTCLIRMVREMIDRHSINRPRLLNLFCNEMLLPVFLIWILHKEDVMTLDTYMSLKYSSPEFAEAFSSELISDLTTCSEELWILEILSLMIRNSQSTLKDKDAARLKKISKNILDLFNKKVLDELMMNSGTVNTVDLSNCCSTDILKKHYLSTISLWMAHRPVLKVADALKTQKEWTYSKLSSSLTLWYKQCLVMLEAGEVLEQMKVVMETQEVNWHVVLSFLSTAVVCMPFLSNLIQDYVDALLRDGLESSNLENLVVAFLFARQCCYEGPLVFDSYPDWFQKMFSESAQNPGGSRKTFTCLIKFLTDMVPFESSLHLKAHIVRPPFVPPKCRELFTDYIMLAKTRLADLKQPLDAESEDKDQGGRKKMNEQIEEDIQKALVLFESTKKIPTSIMEASIFRKPYYVGKFLPVLLKPRALPDIPDLRMKFIDTLKLVEKIPLTLYNNYITACKAESSKLLEGVFLDEEEEMDMELTETEQLQMRLDQLLKAIQENPHNRMIEQCSLVREKLLSCLYSEDSNALCNDCLLLNTDAADIPLPNIKVVDQLLEFLASACLTVKNNTDTVSWPQDFFTILKEIKEMHSALLIRIWKLVTEQGSELECHHIKTLGFLLAYLHEICLESLPVEIVTCQNSCQRLCGEFVHLIWQELPVITNKWRKFSLRIMLDFVNSLSSMRGIAIQDFLPETFLYKFQFLYHHIKYFLHGDQSVDEISQLTEKVKAAIYRVKLSFRSWVQLEMKISVPEEQLSYGDCQTYVYDTVFNFYLMDDSVEQSMNKRCQTLCSELFTELLLNIQRQGVIPVPVCANCKEREDYRQTDKQHHFTAILQTLISYLKPADKSIAWLAQKIQEGMEERDSKLSQEFYIQAVVRLVSCLPAYLIFVNCPSMSGVLDLPCQIINKYFSCLCRHGYLPASITLHILQGMCQLAISEDIEIILERCHLLTLSIVVHTQLTKNLLRRLNKQHSCSELIQIVKITDWIESCRMKPDRPPLGVNMKDSLRSAALLSLVHVRSSSVTEIIKAEKNSKVVEGFSVLLITELSDSKNQFYCKAEAVLNDLLSSAPGTLSYLSGDGKEEWRTLLPESVIFLLPYTLLRFLEKRQKPPWQSSTTFVSSVLLLYKEVLRSMECLPEDRGNQHQNEILIPDWTDISDFVKGCLMSATKDQLRNVSKESLNGCGADIVLVYRQVVSRLQ